MKQDNFKNNVIAGILVNVCERSDDHALLLYGRWLKLNGAIPFKPDEQTDKTSQHTTSVEGSTSS